MKYYNKEFSKITAVDCFRDYSDMQDMYCVEAYPETTDIFVIYIRNRFTNEERGLGVSRSYFNKLVRRYGRLI